MTEKYRIKLNDNLLTGISTRERIKLAKNTKNADILRELSKSKNKELRMYVANNPNTPADILKKLANDENKDVRAFVAHNTSTPLDILRKLNEDESYDVRNLIKSNPTFKKYVKTLNLSELDEIDYMGYNDKKELARNSKDVEILKKLAKDDYDWIREYVAGNPNCPVNILRELANDEYWSARKAVAQNPNTPVDILKKLSKDEDDVVRRTVAENPNTPVDILKKLAEDKNGYINNEAKYNPTYKKYIKSLNLSELDELDYMSYVDKRGLALNPSTPVDVLKKLAEDENKGVREYVARNSGTPVDILRKLAKDKDEFIRICAKNNHNYGSGLEQYELSSLSPSQIRTRIFRGSKESRIEALKYALDNIDKFDNSLFGLVAELNIPYLNEVLETHPNTPDELFEEE